MLFQNFPLLTQENRDGLLSAKTPMAKEYFADNARFADLCNNILYGGREVILPENLKERDTTEVLTALGLDKDHSDAEARGYL